MIPIFAGYDEREAVAYHVFCQSIIDKATKPVSFHPLALNTLTGYHEVHKDGSNAFIYSRFLVPYLMNYQGWAIFADSDMVVMDDIAKLWRLRDPSKAVMVAKHDYKTKYPGKYLGNRNEDYPRKNWSSVILWNCGHPANKVLTPRYIETATGADLHQFKHIDDEDIGTIPTLWNWLTMEYPHNSMAQLLHFSIGTPCFPEYADCDHSKDWWEEYAKAIRPLERNG